MITFTWLIDLHDLAFLRESKEWIWQSVLSAAWHESIHGFIDAFFHIDSSIQILMKIWVDKEELFIGGNIADCNPKPPFLRCIAAFFQWVFDIFRVVQRGTWHDFVEYSQEYWSHIVHFQAQSYDFDYRMCDYLRRNKNLLRNGIHEKFDFRVFELHLRHR